MDGFLDCERRRHKYRNDAVFRRIVDSLAFILQSKFASVADVNDCCTMAIELHEYEQLRVAVAEHQSSHNG